MRRLLLSLILPVTLFAAKAGRAEALKIGYVDVQRAVHEVEEGKQAEARLKSELEDRRRQFDLKKAAVQKMRADYDKQMAVLSEDAKRKKQEEIEKAVMEAQQSASEMQGELTAKEQEVTSSIGKRLLQIVGEVSEHEGLSFVLDKAVLLHAPSSADITNEVVRRYNDKFAVPAAPPAKPDKKPEKKGDKK